MYQSSLFFSGGRGLYFFISLFALFLSLFLYKTVYKRNTTFNIKYVITNNVTDIKIYQTIINCFLFMITSTLSCSSAKRLHLHSWNCKPPWYKCDVFATSIPFHVRTSNKGLLSQTFCLSGNLKLKLVLTIINWNALSDSTIGLKYWIRSVFNTQICPKVSNLNAGIVLTKN